MDFRQLFSKTAWWGKLIGAFFGFFIAGPTGALFGILVGNFFDRGLSLHLSQPFWHYQNEKNANIKKIFFESTFSVLGHLAKADGHVSPEAIEYTKQIMDRMRLSTKQIQLAQHCFQQGKSKQYPFTQQLSLLYQAIHTKPQLIHLFVNTQYQCIKTLGLSDKKMEKMNDILAYLQLAPLYQNQQFAQDFPWFGTHYHQAPPNQDRYQSYSNHYEQKPNTPPPRRQDPYQILEVSPHASKTEVKRAYRRKISQHHPDKLIAKGASASTIKSATEKTQAIRKAYETICASNGW